MDLLQKIYDAGVVGAGGAGFPSHKKLVPAAEYLIVNAAECEPLLSSDRYVMRTFPDEIISALERIKAELNISKVVIGLKKKYQTETESLNKAIAAENSSVELFFMQGIYPAGDEQVMVYEITGRTVPPGGIPIHVGAVVTNVTTVLNIYDALDGSPVIKKFVTVTGEVKTPVIAEAPVGTSVADLIAAAGGVTAAAAGGYVFIMGGPMMGKQFDENTADSTFIKKTDGGIIVLPKGHHVHSSAQKSVPHMVNQAKSACIQCAYCTDMCPRHLIGHKLRPNKIMRSIATGTDAKHLPEALLCSECGVCEMYACPMHLSPRKINIYIKGLLREQGVTLQDKNVYPEQTEVRDGRQIPQSRLIGRLNLSGYPNEVRAVTKISPNTVSIALKHGIGKPASPTVSVGQRVERGDVIGSVDFGDVGALVHASISGTVTEVSPVSVTVSGL